MYIYIYIYIYISYILDKLYNLLFNQSSKKLETFCRIYIIFSYVVSDCNEALTICVGINDLNDINNLFRTTHFLQY